MYRVAIIEDDEVCCRELQEKVHSFGIENKIPLKIDMFRDGDEIVGKYPANYDILLMDIVLPLLNGINAADEIRRMDPEVDIVFITNYPEYAIQGYQVRAAGYFLKPIDYAALYRTLTTIIERKVKRYLAVSVKGGLRKLEIRMIRYVEVQNHNLTFHTVDGDFTAKGAIRNMVAQLEGEGFFRCNKGHLVNLAYVDAVVGQDVHIGTDVITVSRMHKKAFIDALNLYIH